LAAGAALVFCVVSIELLIGMQAPRFFLLDDAGYGDSYVLYDVLHFQSSGVIYRDLSRPPYLPSTYSPLVYILYSLPGRIVHWGNPFLGPRLVAVAAFLLCIVMAASIAGALIPERSGRFWALLLGGSIACMYDWVLQIRGDFPGIFLNLAAIRLLLVGSPWAVVLAGVCAGLATQFKYTFVAALAAGCLWLLVRRRWKDLARFAASGFLASAGLYLLFSLREPRMISQITALRIAFVDLTGCLQMIYTALCEPVVILAILAIPLASSRISPRWVLLFLFALTSFAIAGLLDLHPGGNINYFYEALFATLPAAALGVLRLMAWARRRTVAGLFVAALFLLQFARPRVDDLLSSISAGEIGFRAVDSRNAEFRRLQYALRGQHIFSTVSRLALLDPAPALLDAFSLWKVDPQPIFDRIRKSEFDVVITTSSPTTWRGVEHVGPDLRNAIVSAYAPQCVARGALLQLPRNRPPDNALLQELNRIGCAPIAGTAGLNW